MGHVHDSSDIGQALNISAPEVPQAAMADRSDRLLRITSAIADAVTAHQVFEAAVEHVAAALDASSAALWLLDDNGRARLVRSVGYDEAVKRRFDEIDCQSTSRFPALDALTTGAPVFVASPAELLERYPHLRAAVTPGRAYRVACLPLSSGGRTFGALGITIEQPGDGPDGEREFLLLVARYAGQAVGRLRLLEAERQSRERAEQMYAFADAVTAAGTVDEVFHAALTAINRALAVNRSSILVADGDGVMRFRAWIGLSDQYRAAVDGHSPWPKDAASPSPVLVADTGHDDAMEPYREIFRSERIGAMAFIPLVSDGRLMGKFMVYHDGPHRFLNEEVETAVSIASHLASVIAKFSAIAKLEETIRYNELFAGALAHDLRNPLCAIITAAQLALLQTPADARGNPALPLNRLLRSGKRMTRMIDQLLDVTMARRAGRIRVYPRAANLAHLCTEAIAELKTAHPAWTIITEHAGDPAGTWDPDRILQVVSNLVANAGQHGRDGAVTVSVDGSHPDVVRMEVANRGAIADAVLPTLFDPFRLRNTGAHQRPRVGLGLFIVKTLVFSHGGTLDVRSSREADATTVSIVLPRSSPAEPPASAPPA